MNSLKNGKRYIPAVIVALTLIAMQKPPPEPLRIELNGIGMEPATGAINVSLFVEEEDPFRSVRRVEIWFENAASQTVFRAMLNRSSVCDPIPPGAFGVFSEAGDIRSAGMGGHWDESGDGGTLLARSSASETNGQALISFWVQPKDWPAGRYTCMARAFRRKRKTAPSQPLIAFDLKPDGDLRAVFEKDAP